DIDGLIDEAASEKSAAEPELVEEDDEFDLDDIDTLADETAGEGSAAEPELVEDNDEFDFGDIDSLLDQTADTHSEPEAGIEPIEAEDELDLGDIESLADDTHNTQLDEALADSMEELSNVEDELDVEDVESIASSLVDELEPESEIIDTDDLLAQSSEESTNELLDEDDLLDEYDDPSLKSVDDLLNELQQEDDYVEPPEWSDVDELNDELNDEIEEVEIDLGDDPLADEELADEFDLALADEPLNTETVTPSVELDEYPELELDDEESEGSETLDDSNADTPELQLSQAEQDLANAMATGQDLDSLEQDFDDELLIEDELLADDIPSSEEPQLSDALTADEDTDDAIESAIELDESLKQPPVLDDSLDPQQNELSDDQLDDDFMADLTQTDFDALLSELAEPESLEIDESSDFEVDFNALLSEDLAELEEFSTADEMDLPEQVDEVVTAPTNEDETTEEFVDIDALIEQSDDANLDHEPYDDVNMDVGLSEFDALLAGDNPTDVDLESGGFSAKLDLARAYIEIGDMDAALDAIEDVIANGPEEVQEEALSLKAKLA
ncbi:FimV/HubP family polar landmark protein, partial [Pseudoalteromonas haloplanktis]